MSRVRGSAGSNYVIVSSHAWRAFERLFPDAEFGGFFDLIELRASVQRVFEDKHGKTHRVRILESSRTLSVSPPKPSNPASEGGE